MPAPANQSDNYEFNLVGADKYPFRGYVSSVDPTNCATTILVQGSQNVYKKNSGTIANRPGRLLRGVVDALNAGTVAEYVWNTSLGITLPTRVNNGRLQVESNLADGVTYLWYTLLSGLTLPRFVLDPWWDSTNQKDVLLGVNGDATIKSWSGGVAKILSTSAPVAGTVKTVTIGAGGMAYNIGDVLRINSGNNDATVIVTNTGVSGAVTNVRIQNAGTGYSNTSGIATTNLTGAGSGATINVTAIQTAGTITISGTKTWGQMGFDTSGSLLINGNTYAYNSGGDGTVLYGVLPDPSAEPAGSIAVQTVTTHSANANGIAGLPAAGFNNDFLKVIGNRAHIGSYTSREVWVSSAQDYTNYSVPSPRTPGDPELLILDNTGRGISVSRGNAFIAAGTKDWYEVSYQPLTVGTVVTEQTLVDKKPTSELSAALAHEYIDTVGDDIVYLSQDQQLRQLGTFRNIITQKIPSLSQEIVDELQAETFVNGFHVGQVKAVGDLVYLVAPASGKVYVRQTRETVDENGNVVAERLWYAPMIWGASKVSVITGVEFIHSNSNPQIYQIWNTGQWHDDSPSGPVSYLSAMQLAYRNYGRRQGLWKCNRIYYEGYMTEGTQLMGENLVEFEGSKTTQQIAINSNTKPARFYSSNSSSSLGDTSLGDNPLGDGLDTLGLGQQDLPKFRAIRMVNPSNFFEHSLVVFSQNLDDRWEILAIGANTAIADDQQAGFISS